MVDMPLNKKQNKILAKYGIPSQKLTQRIAQNDVV